MGFPAVNAQEDPSYEQGLTPGSVLPGLAQCSLDDGKLPTLQWIISIFTDAQVKNEGAEYVRDHLAQLPDVSADDRAKLVDGSKQDLDTTLRHLADTVADCCCNRTSMTSDGSLRPRFVSCEPQGDIGIRYTTPRAVPVIDLWLGDLIEVLRLPPLGSDYPRPDLRASLGLGRPAKRWRIAVRPSQSRLIRSRVGSNPAQGENP